MRNRFEAQGVDAAERLLSEAYGRVSMRRRGADRVGMDLTTTDLGALRLDRLRMRLEFSADVDPLGAWVFGELLSGTAQYSSGGVTRDYVPGDAVLAAQYDEDYATRVEDADLRVVLVDPAFVDDVACGPDDDPVRFTGYHATDASSLALFRSTFAFVRRAVVDAPGVDPQPLVTSAAARLLVATALATFPNTALTAPTPVDRRDAHPHALRRAISFIESNSHRDLGSADIAAAAHVSIRALQLALRRHLDTTPMAYVRRVRLHRAHDDLRAADPSRTTVAAVAARWGLLDASRFAAQYLAEFSVPPGATLRS